MRYQGSLSLVQLVPSGFDSSLTSDVSDQPDSSPSSASYSSRSRRSEAPHANAWSRSNQLLMALHWCDIAARALCSNWHEHVVGDHVPRQRSCGILTSAILKYLPDSRYQILNVEQTSRFHDTLLMTSPLLQITKRETQTTLPRGLEVNMNCLRRIVTTGHYIKTPSFEKSQLIGIPFLKFESNI